MYTPKYFQVTDEVEIFSFIEKNAFGQLIATVGNRMSATHLPFLVSEDRSRLFAHLAIQNPQASELEGREVLVTFAGPHDYISPTWYTSPGVPTWNYQAVHVYGNVTILNDSSEKRWVVDELSKKYESFNAEPWVPDYKDTMLGAIVAFEINITETQCTYKLSQNKSAQDRAQVIDKLKGIGSTALAEAMERNES